MENNILDIALPFIKREEGLRLTAYADMGGRYTIGYGSTNLDGHSVQPGMVCNLEQAEEQLLLDAQNILPQLKLIVKVNLHAQQYAALLSFSYNLGIFNLKKSGLLRKLNLGDVRAAADQFLLWNRVGLYVSPGLSARRERERSLFLSKDLPSLSDTSQPTE